MMDAKKPKYSLFPTPPSTKPLRPPSPPQQESSTSAFDPDSPTLGRERSPPPPVETLPSEFSNPQNPSPSPEPSHPDSELAAPSSQQPTPELDPPTSPSEMTMSSFSTASGSSLKPAPLYVQALRPERRKSPQRAFIRHGLGGAGNYHKRPDSATHSDYSGFLSALLGTFKHKKRETRRCSEADSTASSQYSDQALPLGAAEILKRKILGQTSGGKGSTTSDPN